MMDLASTAQMIFDSPSPDSPPHQPLSRPFSVLWRGNSGGPLGLHI
jgi:hypothetical protein